jgi:hypothetical protein
VRIVSGNYGVEGHFVQLQETFKFVLPTFQPPCIQSLTTTYDLDMPAPAQKPASPEIVLTENDFGIANFWPVGGDLPAFAPFQQSQDLRPTLYLGFTLPAGRTSFPNSTITMFFRGAEPRYGQRTVPLDPDVSRGAGDAGTNISHRFMVTNPGPSAISYTHSVLGSQWTPVLTLANADGSPGDTSPSTIDVPAGRSVEIDVQVTVPPGTLFGTRDIGTLRLRSPDQVLYMAEFVTFAPEEEPQIEQLRLAWEYWNGETWATLVVRDETDNLTSSGTVEFLAPPDFAAHTEFGTYAWWLRVRWDTGDYDSDPRINRIFLNTTMAAQTVTVRNEVLGSSDGSANQKLSTTRAPVLSGQRLAVREPEMPSGDELRTILEDEGPDAVSATAGGTGKPSEIWVTWHEVPDFYASDARSRHYALDRITGEISFGDGLSGMVPPIGAANIRLTPYRTGGGVRGNRPAESIVQLKTTLPYIDKVTNFVEATGGVEAESMDSLVSHAPRQLRHRGRAVTQEDYEDLVHLASSDVARVRCVPNRDLVADPFDSMPPVLGNVSLIIVPDTTDPKPQPSVELVRRVQSFIAASCPVTATVFVVGPRYLQVNVQAEVGLASLEGAGTVAAKVQGALAAFLHPLTGGFDKQGWEFGREPHRSDVYAVLKEIPEVDHIRALSVESVEDFPGSRQTDRFLVYSGNHTVKLIFEP